MPQRETTKGMSAAIFSWYVDESQSLAVFSSLQVHHSTVIVVVVVVLYVQIAERAIDPKVTKSNRL
jgi:hypothetical protein